MNDHQWDLLLTAKLRIFSRYKRETFDAIHYVPVGKKEVQIYVFFHTDEELRDHETSGLTQDIRARFDQELNAVGLGPAQGIPNRFEFDSFENVVRNFEGNYYYRLK